MNEKEYTLARLILRLANTIVKNRNVYLGTLDLTASQADSLRFFLSNPGASMTELKEFLGITHQTARGLVFRMEAKGLVQVQRSDRDARIQRVFPTAAGEELGDTLHRNGIRTGSRLLRGMTEEEQQQFYLLAQTALRNVEHYGVEEEEKGSNQ